MHGEQEVASKHLAPCCRVDRDEVTRLIVRRKGRLRFVHFGGKDSLAAFVDAFESTNHDIGIDGTSSV